MIKRLPMKSLLTLFGSKGGGGGFDPLTYDANTVALWDGDDAGASNWVDQVASHDIVYGTNGGGTATTLSPTGINNHQFVQFHENGVYRSYGQVATPVRTQPSTQYFVVGNDFHAGNRYWFDDGAVAGRNKLQSVNPSPNTTFSSNATGINNMTELTLPNFHIVTIVKDGVNSTLTIDGGTPKTWSNTNANDAGITLNSNTLLSTYTGTESKWAYIIMRNGADDVDTQKLFTDFLKTRFAL